MASNPFDPDFGSNDDDANRGSALYGYDTRPLSAGSDGSPPATAADVAVALPSDQTVVMATPVASDVVVMGAPAVATGVPLPGTALQPTSSTTATYTRPAPAVLALLTTKLCFCVDLVSSVRTAAYVLLAVGIAWCVFGFPGGLVVGAPSVIGAVVCIVKHRRQPEATWPITTLMVFYVVHAVVTAITTLAAGADAARHCRDQMREPASSDELTDPVPTDDTLLDDASDAHDDDIDCDTLVAGTSVLIIVLTLLVVMHVNIARVLMVYRSTVRAYGRPLPQPSSEDALSLTATVATIANSAPGGAEVVQGTATGMEPAPGVPTRGGQMEVV